MKRALVILALLVVPVVAMAQDSPPTIVITDPPKITGTDWEKIIDRIGYYFLAALTAVLSFIAQYRAGNAVKKADEALVQGKANEKKIIETAHEAKEDVSTQTVALLQAKIAEKPVVVPVHVPPTIPPVE